MLQVLVPLIICVASATSREIAKTYRTVPTISNSLVNLGKMDISFYFNGKPDALMRSDHSFHTTPYMAPKQEPMDEPCVCSSLRNMKDSFFTNPSEIINKILRSNDLFSNKEPATSNLCCDTHEHEETVVFEIAPNQKKQNNVRSNIFPPFIFESIMANKQMSSPLKPKAVEIFLFPKRKDMVTFDLPKMLPKKSTIAKDRIQIVGDKFPIDTKPATSSSVKKDLMDKAEKKEVEKIEILKPKEEVVIKPNAL